MGSGRLPQMGMLLALALLVAGGDGGRPAAARGAGRVAPRAAVSRPAMAPARLRRMQGRSALPARGARPPRTPKGLPPCTQALRPSGDLPRTAGEAIRYLVEVDGISVGTVDFKIERRGTYEGLAVTEYRSLFKLDSLVSVFLPVEGRAASLVPEGDFWPRMAMNRYTLDDNRYEENVVYAGEGNRVAATRSRNGKESRVRRTFAEPVPDFVSGFYLLRSLPAGAEGCSLLFGNQRAYTVWLTHDGKERVQTPVGMRLADRYRVRYASERSKAPLEAVVWIGVDAARLPYRAEITGKHRLQARIHVYETGS